MGAKAGRLGGGRRPRGCEALHGKDVIQFANRCVAKLTNRRGTLNSAPVGLAEACQMLTFAPPMGHISPHMSPRSASITAHFRAMTDAGLVPDRQRCGEPGDR